MIALALGLLIVFLWWPLPRKNEWALWWTGILLLLIGSQIAYPKTFIAISLGFASLLTWLEAMRSILVRRFSTAPQLIRYNQKTFGLMVLNLVAWLPLLFRQSIHLSWFNQQLVLVARTVNGITTLGLVIFWLAIIALQFFSKPMKADYLIVLGAGLHHAKVPPVLAARLQQAIACWKLNPAAKIIVTGGILHGEDISEAQAMADYLMAHDIPQTQIIREEQAMNTWDNLRNCQKLLPTPVKNNQKVVVVTSSFHVFRTKNYLRRLSLDWNISPSKTPWRLQPLTVIRDYLGIVRDHYRSWLVILIVGLIISEI